MQTSVRVFALVQLKVFPHTLNVSNEQCSLLVVEIPFWTFVKYFLYRTLMHASQYYTNTFDSYFWTSWTYSFLHPWLFHRQASQDLFLNEKTQLLDESVAIHESIESNDFVKFILHLVSSEFPFLLALILSRLWSSDMASLVTRRIKDTPK